MQQQTIFDLLYEDFKIDKPIRLIELFAGYGSQALALKYLGVPFEHYKICEWNIKSIQAYKDIHFNDKDVEINSKRTKEEMVEFLYRKGISNNWNEPMTLDQINRMSKQQLETIIKNIAITNNLVNIQNVKGEDLNIVDSHIYIYICTYSFPCQDLSLSGLRKGMSDTSTRSGLLWEVERLLKECKQKGELPQVLLMENVPQVHSLENLDNFTKWQSTLEELGYKNYFQDLIATDYGIPQTRNRCFMVSILGDYNYKFPQPMPLKLRLKDVLEDHVDDKYFLDEKTIEQISNWKSYQNPLDNVMGEESISATITTRIAESIDGGINASMKVLSRDLETTTNLRVNDANIIGHLEQWHQRGFIYDENNSMTTICATDYKTPKLVGIRIKNANSKGYIEATEGDGIDISSRMEYHRGTVQKGKAQTITTMGGENVGVVVNDLKIRKLTPRECFRLMGVKDEDYDKLAEHQSDSTKYHLTGDSIVVNVLMAIFKEMM